MPTTETAQKKKTNKLQMKKKTHKNNKNKSHMVYLLK